MPAQRSRSVRRYLLGARPLIAALAHGYVKPL
jgi:hypothetical protein